MYRINGNLAVARAIGDIDYRPWVSGELLPAQQYAVLRDATSSWLVKGGGWDWLGGSCILLAIDLIFD